MFKNGNRGCVTKIIVERVYVGNRKMEDVFRPISICLCPHYLWR